MVILQTLRLSIGARVVKFEGRDTAEVNQATRNQQDSPVCKCSNVSKKRSCLNMGVQLPVNEEAEPYFFSLFSQDTFRKRDALRRYLSTTLAQADTGTCQTGIRTTFPFGGIRSKFVIEPADWEISACQWL